MVRRQVLGLLALVPMVAACGLTDGRFLSPEGCRDRTAVDAVLWVDPTDDRWIWATERSTGRPISLRIPGGYGVQTDPPVIIDLAGRAIGRTGDRITNGCRDIVADALMIDEQSIVPAS